MREEVCVICGEGMAFEADQDDIGKFMKCDTCDSEYYSADMMEELKKEKTFQTINNFLNFVIFETQGKGGDCIKLEKLFKEYLD